MSPVLEAIARENFRTSGYISRPDVDRKSALSFTRRLNSSAFATDLVRDALQRRERARQRDLNPLLPTLKERIHALLRK